MVEKLEQWKKDQTAFHPNPVSNSRMKNQRTSSVKQKHSGAEV